MHDRRHLQCLSQHHFGAPANLALGVFVVLTIILLNRSDTPWVRLSAIIIGLALGSLAAWFSGKLVPHALPDLPLVSLPIPFRFGFTFDWSAFLPIALIYLISSIETVGDLTANCMIARQPISGPSYYKPAQGRRARRRRQLHDRRHLQCLSQHHFGAPA
ncbi:solute carrier family 23 protein, partial [Corynebacterium diphtheriae]